jgi:hypothetical protein
MTRRGNVAPEGMRGAFLADFGRADGGASGFRLFTDRLELQVVGDRGPRRRVVPLARITQARVLHDGNGVVLRVEGLDTRLDIRMVSAWEATLAAELIAGLREISDVQSRVAFGPSGVPPRPVRPRKRSSATRRRTSRGGRSLVLALDSDG